MKKIWLVFNKIIPFKGYNAITFYPWVFVRKDASKWTLTDTRHETTHLWQQDEVLMLGYCATTILAILGIVSWWWLLAVPFYFYVGYVCTKLAYHGSKGDFHKHRIHRRHAKPYRYIQQRECYVQWRNRDIRFKQPFHMGKDSGLKLSKETKNVNL